MSKGDNHTTTYRAPQWGGPWTSPDGLAHIRNAGTGHTYCGVLVGAYTNTHPADACDHCIKVSLAHYATTHTCTGECRS